MKKSPNAVMRSKLKEEQSKRPAPRVLRIIDIDELLVGGKPLCAGEATGYPCAHYWAQAKHRFAPKNGAGAQPITGVRRDRWCVEGQRPATPLIVQDISEMPIGTPADPRRGCSRYVADKTRRYDREFEEGQHVAKQNPGGAGATPTMTAEQEMAGIMASVDAEARQSIGTGRPHVYTQEQGVVETRFQGPPPDDEILVDGQKYRVQLVQHDLVGWFANVQTLDVSVRGGTRDGAIDKLVDLLQRQLGESAVVTRPSPPSAPPEAPAAEANHGG